MPKGTGGRWLQVVLLAASACPLAWGQVTLNLYVKDSYGGPLEVPVQVQLSSPLAAGGFINASGMNGLIRMSVAGGEYMAEVSAPGYRTAHERVMVIDGFPSANAYVVMKKEGESNAASGDAASALDGKARKELELAVASLSTDKPPANNKHLDYALKHAPRSPAVQYVAALYALHRKDAAAARGYLDAAVQISPDYYNAQSALGGLLLDQGDFAGAIPHLERAAALNPTSWRTHWMLAEAYLRGHHDPAKARLHAARAMELGKDKAAAAALTQAVAEVTAGDRDAARATLGRFLQEYPKDAAVSRARGLLNQLESAALSAVAAEVPRPLPGAGLMGDLPAGGGFGFPGGIDVVVPPVEQGIACPLPQVLQGAARRASEFTDALERFAATEVLVHDELDAAGIARRSGRYSFEYLAALEHPRPGLLVVREMRNGRFSNNDFAERVATEGLPAIGLVLHPYYTADFDFSCEGLGHWHGEPAWQVRFAQRSDHPARIHDWVARGQSYPAILKGRAWISASSYYLLRVEAELAKPIPEIRLEAQHMTIDYAPVAFAGGQSRLWLPASAEVFGRLRGRVYRQQHSFSNFTLFSVDTKQQIKDPSPQP